MTPIHWRLRIASAFAKVMDLDYPTSDPDEIGYPELKTRMEKALTAKADGVYEEGKWFVIKEKDTGIVVPAFVPIELSQPQFTGKNLLVAPCPPYCPDQNSW